VLPFQKGQRQCYFILFQSGTVLLKYFHDLPIQDISLLLKTHKKTMSNFYQLKKELEVFYYVKRV
jgi:hypothetical protein